MSAPGKLNFLSSRLPEAHSSSHSFRASSQEMKSPRPAVSRYCERRGRAYSSSIRPRIVIPRQAPSPIAKHPRRGGILILPLLVILRSAATKDLGLESGKTKSENQHRDPSGGEAALRMTALFVILSAAVCHPEAGTIADRGASPEGRNLRPCLCLSSRANARDLGVESGPNHKRDPSAMEPPSGFLSKIKPERNQEGASSAGISPEKNRGSAASLFIHSISPVEFNSQDQHPVVDDLHYQPPVTDPVAP